MLHCAHMVDLYDLLWAPWNRPFIAIEEALHSLQHDVHACVCEMHEQPNMNQLKNIRLYSTCGVQQPSAAVHIMRAAV